MYNKKIGNGGLRKPAGKPFPKKETTGARRGDYVVIGNGNQKVTTRVSTEDHPFCGQEPGFRTKIKGGSWKLLRIIHQGTEEYHKVYDADTQREHYGF